MQGGVTNQTTLWVAQLLVTYFSSLNPDTNCVGFAVGKVALKEKFLAAFRCSPSQVPFSKCYFTVTIAPVVVKLPGRLVSSHIYKYPHSKNLDPQNFWSLSQTSEKRILASLYLFRLSVRMEQLGSHWTDFRKV